MTRYYFDTNAMYAFYRQYMGGLLRHDRYAHYSELQGGGILRALLDDDTTVFVSPLTCLEFVGVLLRHERGKELKREREVDPILELLSADIGKIFQMVPQADWSLAQTLLLEHARRGGCALDTNDAIHIATAKQMQPPVILVTSDGGKQRGNTLSKMKCVCQRTGLAFFDPEEQLTTQGNSDG